MMTDAEAAPPGVVKAAVAGAWAAAAIAYELDYRGLAAALEDLALVLGAVPAMDAHRIADALLSSPQRG